MTIDRTILLFETHSPPRALSDVKLASLCLLPLFLLWKGSHGGILRGEAPIDHNGLELGRDQLVSRSPYILALVQSLDGPWYLCVNCIRGLPQMTFTHFAPPQLCLVSAFVD